MLVINALSPNEPNNPLYAPELKLFIVIVCPFPFNIPLNSSAIVRNGDVSPLKEMSPVKLYVALVLFLIFSRSSIDETSNKPAFKRLNVKFGI